jgi:hypothetical protein
MKSINKWTKRDFMRLPRRKWDENVGSFKSLVIIPMKNIHNSGYRNMDFVAVDKKGVPICRLTDGSDILHIEGIGGYGIEKMYGNFKAMDERKIPVAGWTIDCLKRSKLIRLFCDREIVCEPAISSFEIYSKGK